MKTKILIYWEGFPVCGLLTSELFANPNIEVDLFVSKPAVPFENFFEGFGVIPMEDKPNKPEDIDLSPYDLVVTTGWNSPYWRKVCEAAKRQKIKTCVVVDNNWRATLRQILGRVYFRFFYAKLYDFAFCPGTSGRKLLSYLGMDSDRIVVGNYGSFSKIYFSDADVESREDRFVFLGQFIQRKGILDLLSAYKSYRDKGGTWSLELIGSGELKETVKGHASVKGLVIRDFMQPAQVAEFLRTSRCLVLPSHLEHWGTVVCEAAACGCSLLLSDRIGSSDDMLMPGVNGLEFQAGNSEALAAQMMRMQNLPFNWHQHAANVSRNLAETKSEKSYMSAITYMLSYEDY